MGVGWGGWGVELSGPLHHCRTLSLKPIVPWRKNVVTIREAWKKEKSILILNLQRTIERFVLSEGESYRADSTEIVSSKPARALPL